MSTLQARVAGGQKSIVLLINHICIYNFFFSNKNKMTKRQKLYTFPSIASLFFFSLSNTLLHARLRNKNVFFNPIRKHIAAHHFVLRWSLYLCMSVLRKTDCIHGSIAPSMDAATTMSTFPASNLMLNTSPVLRFASRNRMKT